MTKQIDSELRAQIRALTPIKTVTTPTTTYNILAHYQCDICNKEAAICIRERGRDLYSRCGCGVDARPSLIVQRHKLNICLAARKTALIVDQEKTQSPPVRVLPPPVSANGQQPKNLLEYLLNYQIFT